MTYSDFANFLNGRMKERGSNPKRLSELTGISVKHIEALRHANLEDLPSAPYVRGYLSKLGAVLEFDGNEWWERIKDGAVTEELDPADELPKNRFAKKSMRRYILGGALALALLLYLGFRAYAIIGKPVIEIDYPREQMLTTDANWVSLRGTLRNADSLKANGESIEVGANGEWQKTVTLAPGINTIEFRAQKFLGRETKVVRQIVYQPPSMATTTSSPPLNQ